MGFSAEIHDFLNSAKDTWKLQSDTEYKNALAEHAKTQAAKLQQDIDNPLNQEEQQGKIDYMRARIGHMGAMEALQRQQLDLARKAANATPMADAYSATPAPSAAAIPAGPPAVAPTTQDYARGGAVPYYAGGGPYEDDDDEEDTTPGPAIGGYPAGNLPPQVANAQAQMPPAIGGGVPMPQARPAAAGPRPGMQPTGDPVTDAQKYGISQVDAAGMIGPGRRGALNAYARGAGAAPVNDMLAIYKKVDPDGTLPEGERNLRALQAVYRYKMNSGAPPEEAQKVAFQMLQHYRTMAQNYAAISAAAIQGGDVPAGLKAAMKAYANVPDGNDMKLWQSPNGQINYEVTGPDGKKTSAGIATPDQIAGAAMGLAGGGFDNILVQRAGGVGKKAGEKVPKAGEGDQGGADVPKPTDYKELEGQVDEHIKNYVANYNASDAGKKNPIADNDPNINAMKNVVFHIRRNNDVTTDESMRLAQSYINAPDKLAEGQKPAFRVDKSSDDTRTIQFADGRKISMPTSDYASLAAARGQAIKEAEEKAKKPPEDTVGDKMSRAGTAVGKALEYGYGDVPPPPGYETAKKAIGAIPEIASKVIPALKNVGKDIPYNPEDRPL